MPTDILIFITIILLVIIGIIYNLVDNAGKHMDEFIEVIKEDAKTKSK